MEGGETWGDARSTCNKANPRIKINKTHKSQKNGGYFSGYFRIRMKNNKIKLENEEGGSEIVINVAHDTKMM